MTEPRALPALASAAHSTSFFRAAAVILSVIIGIHGCGGEPTAVPVATQIAFTAHPADAAAGDALTVVRVAALDADGDAVTSPPIDVTMAITSGAGPSGALLSGTVTRATVDGVATFDGLAIETAGAGYTLTAAATGLASATSTGFQVTHAEASTLAFSAQPSGAFAAGAPLTPPAVKVTDAFGNAVTSSTSVTLTITGGTGAAGAQLAGTVTRATVEGTATFDALAIETAGAGYTLTAAAAGLSSDPSTSFDVIPAAASVLAYTAQPSGAYPAGAPLPPVVVQVTDAYGNVVTSPTSVTLTITSGTGSAGAQLGGIVTQATAGGVATFDGLTIETDGTSNYSLTAGSGALPAVAGSSFRVADVDVLPGSIVQLTYDSLWAVFDKPDLVAFPNTRAQPDHWRDDIIRDDLSVTVDLKDYDFMLVYTAREVPGWITCCREGFQPDTKNMGLTAPGFIGDSAYPRRRAAVHMNSLEFIRDAEGNLSYGLETTFHEMGHAWRVKMLGFIDIGGPWVEGTHPVALLAGGSGHWGFAWFEGGLPRATVGLMHTGPMSPLFNSFDLYQMGLMGYEEARDHPHQVAQCQPDFSSNCKVYPLTVDSLIAAHAYVFPDKVVGDGKRIPDTDPAVASLRTIIVVVRGSGDVMDPVRMQDLRDIAAAIPAGWNTATWGRSQMSVDVVLR